MKLNLNELSYNELVEVIDQASKLVDVKKREQKKTLMDQFKSLANESGLSLEEVMSDGNTKPRKKVAPKFAHPSDASITWTGRGKPPLWVLEVEANGGTRDDLLI